MSGPGKVLQQARKKKRYSIDKVHKTTKIKKEFIEGLENDNASVFPAELYYKNFLKTYAQFLSLDPAEMLNMYEQSKTEQEDDLFTQDNTNSENKLVEFFKNNKKALTYIGYALIGLILICVIIMLIPTKKNSNNFEENTSVAVQTKQNVSSSAKTQQQTEQKLYIKAVEDTWLKIVGDGDKLFENILSKDKTFETTTKNEFIIKIGNIEGVEVYFNDKLVDISKGASGSKVNTITLKRD